MNHPENNTETKHQITSNTVLRSRRQSLTLQTSDGLRLHGELALPANTPPKATIITLHPLPTAGGFMESHILRKAANRLPELANLAILRFNTRGTSSPTGTSDGTFDGGTAERHDLAAAIQYAKNNKLPAPWLLGWSFGTELALKYGLDHEITGAILLSPPLRITSQAELARWQNATPQLHVLVPEHDPFLPPAAAKERFKACPRAQINYIAGGKHLWVGEKQTRTVLENIVAAIGCAEVPLPTTVTSEQLAKS